MKKRIKKIFKLLAGIIAMPYFLSPVFFEAKRTILENTSWYDWFFVPEYVYNYLNTLTNNGHVIPFIGIMLSGIVLWICLYYLFAAIYDIYLDIYLNKRRFEEDIEGD